MEGPHQSAISRVSARFLDALVDDCTEKLRGFLGNKVLSVFGVRDEFNILQDKMKYIKSMLTDAKRRRINDLVSRTWIDELTDVMYDAVDIMDDFRSEFEKQSNDQSSVSLLNLAQAVRNLNPKSWFSKTCSRFEINDRIIKLNKRIDEINQGRKDFSIDMNQIHSSKSSRQTSSIIDSDIVGKEIINNTRKLVNVITRIYEQRKLCVIAIVGMGGIGKTILAQKVYHDPLLMNIFQARVWYCVSQEYSATELLQSIIRQIQPDTTCAETISELHEQLASKINGKRFFLILDDVWQSMVWTDLLKNPLQFAASGVILVTTRDKMVTSRMGAIHVHEVEKLSRRSCWELLCKKAYVEEEEDMLNLREVGMEIAKKCDGLPLAVKVIGSLLAIKNKDSREWRKVLQSNSWFRSEITGELHRALYISYEDLAPPLQDCFLYCSLYPEDYIMRREDLVRVWIAEGFIEQNEDEILEDTAEEYYNQLVKRSLLQPTRYLLEEVVGKIDDFKGQCQMHDIIRTFAHLLAQGNSYYGKPDLLSADSVRKLHRLSIARQGDVAIIPGKQSDSLHLRSLILCFSPPIIQDSLYTRVANLRVLVLNGQGIQNIPSSIGNLKHLRMLDLDMTSISILPASMCSLISLQILRLCYCKYLKEMPQGITELTNLRSLGIVGTPLISVPTGICRLTFLNDLTGFIVGGELYSGDLQSGWHLDELEALTELRCLWLEKLENAATESSILVGKHHLKTLHLSCTLPERISENVPYEEDCINIKNTFERLRPPQCLEYLTLWRYSGRRFPSWLEGLPFLTWLLLINCVWCLHLPPLGQLPYLKFLRIIGAQSIISIGPEFTGTGITRGSNMRSCFPKLEFLGIEKMTNWEQWSFINQVPEEFFPSLLKIDIVNCPKLRALPEQLKHINSMEEFVIDGAQGLKEIGNLTSCFKFIRIKNSSCEKISNIPWIHSLYLVDCSVLRCLENLDALQRLYLKDDSIDHLPEWLPNFLNQQHGDGDIELILVCHMAVLQRCRLGCPDWPIIERFSHARVVTTDNTTFIEYQKHPYSYHTSS
jgi:NB-ARC domain/Rx N-terminal domain